MFFQKRKQLNRILRSLKDDPRFYPTFSPEAEARMEAKIFSRINAEAAHLQQTEPLRKVPSFGIWLIEQYVSKPVAVMTAVVALMAGGWTASVNAATDSMPGDTLYSFKRLSERAQLSFTSLEDRPLLHTEFAGRRLTEAAELRTRSDNTTENLSLARTALEDYETELARAAQDLQVLKVETDEATAVATAAVVQGQIATLQNTLQNVVLHEASGNVSSEVVAAQNATQATSEVATNVVVEVHEERRSADVEREVKDLFRRKLGDVESRHTFDAHRLEVLIAALTALRQGDPAMELPFSPSDLVALRVTFESNAARIPEAMNIFARSGYRESFRILESIESELRAAELRLAEAEIAITALSAQPEEEEAASSTEIQHEGE